MVRTRRGTVTWRWTRAKGTPSITVRFVDHEGDPIPIDDDLYLEVDIGGFVRRRVRTGHAGRIRWQPAWSYAGRNGCDLQAHARRGGLGTPGLRDRTGARSRPLTRLAGRAAQGTPGGTEGQDNRNGRPRRRDRRGRPDHPCVELPPDIEHIPMDGPARPRLPCADFRGLRRRRPHRHHRPRHDPGTFRALRGRDPHPSPLRGSERG